MGEPFYIRYPFFNKDQILKIEMLENLRDFPRDVMDIYCHDFCDGIVCGFEPVVNKKMLFLSKGVVKQDSKLYLVNQPIEFDYSGYESEVSVKICFKEENENLSYQSRKAVIMIDRQLAHSQAKEWELCRFKYEKGASLYTDNYKNLADFATGYNTVNTAHVLYTGFSGHSLNIKILRYFASEAMKCRLKDPMDISFCLLCLNSTRVERAVIDNYLSYHLEGDADNLKHADLHPSLVKVLDMIKNGKNDPNSSYEPSIINVF